MANQPKLDVVEPSPKLPDDIGISLVQLAIGFVLPVDNSLDKPALAPRSTSALICCRPDGGRRPGARLASIRSGVTIGYHPRGWRTHG